MVMLWGMNRPDMETTLELASERDRRLDSWLRYLVGLAVGALTVMASLQKDIPDALAPSLCLKAAWGTLGPGILLGAVALYGRVFAQRGLVRQWVKDRSTSAESAKAAATTGPAMTLFLWAERLCYGCLAAAVLALTAYGLCK